MGLNERDEMELKVAPQVWIIVAVTLPLTDVVLVTYFARRKWSKGE